MRFGGSMASLIVPKWMRSEFRSDIITRATGLFSRRSAINCGRLGAWMGTRTYCVTGERGVQKSPQNSRLSNQPTVLLPIQYFSVKLQLKISLLTSNKNRD